MAKWIKKVATTPLDAIAKVIDSLSGSSTTNAPSIRAVNVALANKADSTALAGKADINHTHTINNVTGLQSALDGKASSSHTHAFSDISGLTFSLDGTTLTITKS